MRDVVVVGGGPAGLRFGQRMAAAGFSTALCDERDQIGKRKICTGIIGAEAFAKMGLPRGSVVNQIQQLKFLSPRGRVVDYSHPEVLAHVVDRTAFDRSLAVVGALQGVEVYPQRRVEAIEVRPDRVGVVARSTEDGRIERFEARLLALATGVNARLNRTVGLGGPTDFLYAVQAHVQVEGLDCTQCFAGRRVAPGAFAWLVPLRSGWARAGLMTEDRPALHFKRLLARIADSRVDAEAPVEADFKPIVQGFKGPSFGARVLAVGEAAGQVKSTTGGGIYYGLLGADLAAEVAQDALRRDRLGAEFLERYERIWKERIGAEIEAGYLYRKAFGRLSDRQIEALFKLGGWNGIIPLVRRRARFDWHLELLTSLVQYGPIRKILKMDFESASQEPVSSGVQV